MKVEYMTVTVRVVGPEIKKTSQEKRHEFLSQTQTVRDAIERAATDVVKRQFGKNTVAMFD